MADTQDPLTRSRTMAAVKSRDSAVELRVRRTLHRAGLRYRLHRRDLPGNPDIVLSCLRVVVFVHGCFWHRHVGCKRASTPTSRTEYWLPKLAGNAARDQANIRKLAGLGWTVLIVWECDSKPARLTALADQLVSRRADLRKSKPARPVSHAGH